MQIKRYLENLLMLCSEHQFGQDAVEWAILSDMVTPTYTDVQADANMIMAKYDAIIVAYRQARQQTEPATELMLQFAAAAGLPMAECVSRT